MQSQQFQNTRSMLTHRFCSHVRNGRKDNNTYRRNSFRSVRSRRMGMYLDRSMIQSPNVEDPLETMTLDSGTSTSVSSLKELPLDEDAEIPLTEGAGVGLDESGLKISFLLCRMRLPVRCSIPV